MLTRIGSALTLLASTVVATPTPLYYGAETPDYNNAIINEMLENVPAIRQPREAYGVWDWDNTCMYGDISESSIYYQVQNLNFRILPEQFEDILSLGYNAYNGDECLPQGINSVLGNTTTNQPFTFQTILRETSELYEKLFHAYIGPHYNLTSNAPKGNARVRKSCVGGKPLKPNMTLAEIRQTNEFNDFAAKFGRLVFNLEFQNGADEFLPCAVVMGMTTLPQLLVGMTEKEIKEFIRLSMRYNLNSAIATVSFTSSGANPIKGDYPTGIRIFNGQEAAMRAFRARNISIYVISASPQLFVDVAADFFSLTYLVPAQNTYGVRFQMKDSKFTGQLVGGDYPITWGPGKAQVTKNFIMPKHNNKPPVWGSGDAQGDCAFMSLVRDGVVHVNNRLKSTSTCIQKFYEKSCQYFNTKEPETNNKYLMQGQDKEIGSWINSGYTTKDGSKYTSGTSTECSAYKFI